MTTTEHDKQNDRGARSRKFRKVVRSPSLWLRDHKNVDTYYTCLNGGRSLSSLWRYHDDYRTNRRRYIIQNRNFFEDEYRSIESNDPKITPVQVPRLEIMWDSRKMVKNRYMIRIRDRLTECFTYDNNRYPWPVLSFI